MFTLTITLGNDAMQTREDISGALRNVAAMLEWDVTTGGPIRDANGNTVGEWKVTR